MYAEGAPAQRAEAPATEKPDIKTPHARGVLCCVRQTHRRGADDVLFIFFEDLKEDLKGSIKKVAAHIGVACDDELLEIVHRQSLFDFMKENATKFDDHFTHNIVRPCALWTHRRACLVCLSRPRRVAVCARKQGGGGGHSSGSRGGRAAVLVVVGYGRWWRHMCV